jgi:predicted Zn finger-like uncharacterized protein
MHIDCPMCQAGYEVPEARLQPDLTLRCHRCGAEFLAPAPGAEPPTALLEMEALPPSPPLTAPPRPPVPRERRDVALRVAWIGSVLLLAGLVVAAFVWREQVATAWPPIARLYAAVGL